jgi:cytochrome c oxidase cbb3-type subunit 3/ubiquinol-cytochrome c reductase cytochrome c subunit
VFLAPSRPWRAALGVAGLCAGLTVAAQGSAGAAQGTAAEVPAPAAAPAQPATGAELYARYCKLCHGPSGKGYAADNAPSLVSPKFLASASDDYIARGIRFGRPDTSMAAYGKERGGPLDDPQIAAIVAFLRAKGPAAAALPEQPASGDGKRGEALFAQKCQSCHGSAKTPGKAPQLFNREFLAAATPGFLRRAIAEGRPPTRMPAFERKLSAGQIDDLVAWLVSQRTTLPAAPRQPRGVPANLPVVIHPEGKAPEFTLREDRFVPAEQVKRALAEGRKIVIIDARAPSDWLQFHIPGAISIPYYDAAQLDRVPNDGTWVVAYCGCPHHASGVIVDALRQRKFAHTAVLDEGILFWKRAGFPLDGQAAGQPE